MYQQPNSGVSSSSFGSLSTQTIDNHPIHGTNTTMTKTTATTIIEVDTKDENHRSNNNDDSDDNDSIYYTPPTGDTDNEKKNSDQLWHDCLSAV